MDWNNSERFEADFMPDKNQTIGLTFDGTQTKGVVDKDFPSKMYGANEQLDSSLSLQGHRPLSRMNTSVGLSYEYKIDSTGKDLSLNLDYANYTQSQHELAVTSYYDSLGLGSRSPTYLEYSLPTDINIWAAKADYVKPVGKNGNIEAGLKGSYVSTNNNAQYWNVVNGEDIEDTAFTNDFTYTEYIYAGYISYDKKLTHRIYFKAGLRGEETQDKGVQLVHDTTFTHSYFSLFPNGLITYKLDTNNTLKLSYRRRIWRPDYQELNPFAYFVNPYAYQKGNPALQPQISNSVYIEEQFKQLFSISVGDEYWTNPITDDFVQNNITDITYNIPVNYTSLNNSYAKVESTIPFAKWFTSMNTLLFMQRQWKGNVQGVDFTNAGFTWSYNSVNTITLDKHWSCEFDFDYTGREVDGPEVDEPVYVLEAGVKRSFAHDRGVITLNCSDIFFSDKSVSSENFSGENFRNYWYYDSRRLRLSISWKLGKSEKERQQKDKASDEEINRIKS